MTKFNVSRRTFVEGGLGLTVANFLPGTTPLAFAATAEERVVAAAKPLGAGDVVADQLTQVALARYEADDGRWSVEIGRASCRERMCHNV